MGASDRSVQHRQRARNEPLQDPLEDYELLFTICDAEAADARHDMGKLLDTLPDRQRLPIQCVKIEGASVTEAAHRTGMSESAVKVGIHRGLEVLAEKVRSRT
jgi:DNA-directed RNA polymerase specialized sigma24 family protein